MSGTRSAAALALLVFAAGGAARAQTSNCDFANGDVDLFVHLRFEDFKDCAPGSGQPCTQNPDEKDLVGWGVVLAPGPGTTGDSGTTNLLGQAAWTGNGGLINTCVHHGAQRITLSLPNPSPYDPEAAWPTSLVFDFTINAFDPANGLPVERFFYTILLTCGCRSDQDACTLDTCTNGLCPYPPAPYDPTRPEVCNAKDDDCDGQTDEGLPPTSPACSDPSQIGCADKTREGFMDWSAYPLIAACGGAWTSPGVDGAASCGHAAGNHAAASPGTGCSAEDLCPVGWHVCYGPDDVAQRLGGGDCADALDPLYPNYGSGAVAPEVSVPPGGAFFASAAREDGAGCTEGVNAGEPGGAVFGCGNMGLTTNACGLFDRAAGDLCGGLRDVEPATADDPATDFGYLQSSEWAWSCGSSAGDELAALTKTLPDRQGGILCCKDSDPSLAEVCDGVDNDGDGATDEVAFGGGAVIEAGEICRSGGECGDLVCTPSGGWDCVDLRKCDDTTCDGVDDDLDGATDEDYVVTPTSCGMGVCAAAGELVCVGGAEADDCAPGAAAEASDVTCDGRDGDCDGATDEDFGSRTSACGVGACAASGTVTCRDGAEADDCAPGEPLAADDASCDGVDDDCDGASDEDAPTTETSCGVGACAATGVERCVGGAMVDECTPGAPAASDATCDGADDDCDGATDEDFAPEVTHCGVGACAGSAGERACADGVASDSCDPLTGASAETCNGVDDDCDGATDEGLTDAGCTDRDEDTVPDARDNCVDIPNTDQADSDGDGVGDACDVVARGGACQGGGAGGFALVTLLFFAWRARARP